MVVIPIYDEIPYYKHASLSDIYILQNCMELTNEKQKHYPMSSNLSTTHIPRFTPQSLLVATTNTHQYHLITLFSPYAQIFSTIRTLLQCYSGSIFKLAYRRTNQQGRCGREVINSLRRTFVTLAYQPNCLLMGALNLFP